MLPMTVTYLNHSGFSVEIGSTLLIFDYYPAGRLAGDPGILSSGDLRRFAQVVVFVSHAHADHFDPVIYDWNTSGKIHYVLGYDVPEPHAGHRMHPGDTYSVAGARIEAYDSTDEGVSFLVRILSYTIFHAGDLNLWHWRDERTLHEIEQAEQDFYRAVKPLEGKEIDLAFFPVDPRQRTLYDAGANYFAMAIKPRVMIPMHFQGRPDVALDFARRTRNRFVDVIALTQSGETTILEKPGVLPREEDVRGHVALSRMILQERTQEEIRLKQEQEAKERAGQRVKELAEQAAQEPGTPVQMAEEEDDDQQDQTL